MMALVRQICHSKNLGEIAEGFTHLESALGIDATKSTPSLVSNLLDLPS